MHIVRLVMVEDANTPVAVTPQGTDYHLRRGPNYYMSTVPSQ